MSTKEILKYIKITLSSVIPLLAYHYYVFCYNKTNHSAVSPYLLMMYFIPVAYLSIIKIKRGRQEWVIPLVFSITGVVNIVAFDQMNVMRQYDAWVYSGMPERPGWSRTKACK